MSPWVPSYPDSDRDVVMHAPTRVTTYPRSGVADLRDRNAGTPVAVPLGMSSHLQLVRDAAPKASPAAAEDPTLRPASFADYVGQAEVVDNIRAAVIAAKREGWQLDHQLFAGPAGLGKTTIAQIVANELGAKLHVTSAPAIEHKGALASLLTGLADGDVLFVDEIHALDRTIAETLYTAMEDRVLDMPAGKRVIRVPLPKFTLIGATTHPGKLPKPLRDRFGCVWQLRLYTLTEMQTIVERAAQKLGLSIDADGAAVVAGASRGTPRIAIRLLRRVRDAASNTAASGGLVAYRDRGRMIVNGAIAAAALTKLGLDSLGLEPLDRRYLALVADRPVGVEAICAELGEDRSTIEDAVEPFLMQAGLVKRGGKGRLATDAGRAHLAEVTS